ncbi:MAG TPA: hypothetical protein VHI93_02960 [Candidatus Thermoplasmatota archaeon]|nr:hypothetical protein [Candidatus Thermoplasmatota archaeon]
MLGIPALMDWGGPPAALFARGLPYIWLWATVFVLLDAVVVVTAHEHIRGGAPTLVGSLRKVWRRMGPLPGWAFLMAFVLSLLAAVFRRGKGRVGPRMGGRRRGLAGHPVRRPPPRPGEDQPAQGGSGLRRGVFRRFGLVTRRTMTFGLFGAAGFLGLVFGGLLLSGAASALGADGAVGLSLLLLCLGAAVTFACTRWSPASTRPPSRTGPCAARPTPGSRGRRGAALRVTGRRLPPPSGL